MSSKVVFDLNAAIGSLKVVSSKSFRPGPSEAFALALSGLETVADKCGVDENNRKQAI